MIRISSVSEKFGQAKETIFLVEIVLEVYYDVRKDL